MTQIVFQAALDPFHAAFRLFRLRSSLTSGASKDKIRILDFFLLFPTKIKEIRLAPHHQSFKRLSETYQYLKPYGEEPESVSIFQRMEPMQLAALQTLIANEYMQKSSEGDLLIPTSKPVPLVIADEAEKQNADQEDLFEFLNTLSSDYETLGANGLKARTGLIEFRYDAI